jgi:hypothetical protein
MRRASLVLLLAVLVGGMAMACEAQTPKTTGKYTGSGGISVSFTKDADGNMTMVMTAIDRKTGDSIFLGATYCDADEWTGGVGGTFYEYWLYFYWARYKIEYVSPTQIKLVDLDGTFTPMTMTWRG